MPDLAPSVFEWSIGGYPGPDASAELEGSALRCRYEASRDAPDDSAVESLVAPTAREWAAFWAACDELGVWGWRARYEPTDPVCDGTGWSLDLALGRRAVRCSGSNAYPKRFEEFQAALAVLLRDERLTV